MHHSEKETESKALHYRRRLDAETIARMQECDALARLLLHRANILLDRLPRFLISSSGPCRTLLEAALLIDVARLIDEISSIRIGAMPDLLGPASTRSFRRLPYSRTIEEATAAAGDGTPVLHPGPDGTIYGNVELHALGTVRS